MAQCGTKTTKGQNRDERVLVFLSFRNQDARRHGSPDHRQQFEIEIEKGKLKHKEGRSPSEARDNFSLGLPIPKRSMSSPYIHKLAHTG
jgi:hypothetical protein